MNAPEFWEKFDRKRLPTPSHAGETMKQTHDSASGMGITDRERRRRR